MSLTDVATRRIKVQFFLHVVHESWFVVYLEGVYCKS
jgi:hypothetical protein